MAKSIKKNAIASTLLKCLNIIFPIFIGPYLAYVLDESYYGEFNRAASIVSWFVPFASFGIYSYGIRAISKVKDDSKQLSYLFTCLFTIGMVSSITTFAIFLIFVFISVPTEFYSLYIILGIQIITTFIYVEWMNEAFENYGFILKKTFIIRLFNLISVFILVRKPTDIVNYAGIISGVNLANYFVSFYYIKKQVAFTKININDLKQFFWPLVSMLLLANANLLYTALDRLFISMQSNTININYYTFSVTITQVITQVINAIVVVTIPRLSNYLGSNRQKDYYYLLDKSSRIFYMIGIPMCIGLACFGKSAIFLYGGEKYIMAGTTLSVFGVRTLFWLVDQSLNYQVIFPHGYESKLMMIYFGCGIINLLLNGLLFVFNIYGAQYYVITTMISEIFVVLFDILLINKYVSKKAVTINHHYFKYLLVSLLFVPVTSILKDILNYQYVLNIQFLVSTVFIIGVCIIIYFAILYVLKDKVLIEFSEQLINQIKQKVRSKE